MTWFAHSVVFFKTKSLATESVGKIDCFRQPPLLPPNNGSSHAYYEASVVQFVGSWEDSSPRRDAFRTVNTSSQIYSQTLARQAMIADHFLPHTSERQWVSYTLKVEQDFGNIFCSSRRNHDAFLYLQRREFLSPCTCPFTHRTVPSLKVQRLRLAWSTKRFPYHWLTDINVYTGILSNLPTAISFPSSSFLTSGDTLRYIEGHIEILCPHAKLLTLQTTFNFALCMSHLLSDQCSFYYNAMSRQLGEAWFIDQDYSRWCQIWQSSLAQYLQSLPRWAMITKGYWLLDTRGELQAAWLTTNIKEQGSQEKAHIQDREI